MSSFFWALFHFFSWEFGMKLAGQHLRVWGEKGENKNGYGRRKRQAAPPDLSGI